MPESAYMVNEDKACVPEQRGWCGQVQTEGGKRTFTGLSTRNITLMVMFFRSQASVGLDETLLDLNWLVLF